jgi:hypothetical protein
MDQRATRHYPCFSTYRLTAENPRLADCFVFAKLTVRLGARWLGALRMAVF